MPAIPKSALPNATTRAAMKEARAIGKARFSDVDELMLALDSDGEKSCRNSSN